MDLDMSLDQIVAARAKEAAAGKKGGPKGQKASGGDAPARGGRGGRGGRGARGGIRGALGAGGPVRRATTALVSRQQQRIVGPIARRGGGQAASPIEGAGKWSHDLNPEYKAPPAPKPAISMGTKVMVLNLDPEITEDELRDLFQTVGTVRSCEITPNAAGTVTNGEVVYRAHEDALKAIEEFHGREVNGRTIRVHILSSNASRAAAKTVGGASPVVGRGSPSAGPVKGRGASGALYSDAVAAAAASFGAQAFQFAIMPHLAQAGSPRGAPIQVGRGSVRGGRGGARGGFATRGGGSVRGGRGGARLGGGGGVLNIPTASGKPLQKVSSVDLDAELDAYTK